MKKKIFFTFIMIVFSVLAFTMLNVSAETDGIYTYKVESRKVTITDCDVSASGTITIPSRLGGYPVTAIGGGYVFRGCDSITSIIIPNSVTGIYDGAFSLCSNLKSVEIGSGVTYIASTAFGACNSLTSINVSESNQHFASVDGVLFDKAKTSLVAYPAGNTGSYIIPDGVTFIKQLAFYECDGLTDLTFSNSMTTIGDNAFYNCDSLKNIIIGDSITDIGVYAFYNCDSLEYVKIGKGITEIGYYTFYDCDNLTDVILGENISVIGSSVFSGCNKLKNITIPTGITEIGYGAFDFCDNLENVYYNGSKTKWDKISISTYNTPLKNATKHYFAYVTLLDENGKEVSVKTQNMNELVDTSMVAVPNGYVIILYKDKGLTMVYNKNTPINENLTLYFELVQLNAVEFNGDDMVTVGGKGTQKVVFATDKEAKYFICTLKIPKGLTLEKITSAFFEIEKTSQVINGETHYNLLCLYKGNGNIPTNQKIYPFEFAYTASKNVCVNDTFDIEILDDVILADDNGNSYKFVNVEKTQIIIIPTLVSNISIIGENEIYCSTGYTVSVLPTDATNKNVDWSISDETIATISQDGVLTPIKKGTVTITAIAKDGSGIAAEKTVIIKELATINNILLDVGMWEKEYSIYENKYIIYVPKATTLVKITAKHNGTLKSKDGSITFVNSVPRTVVLSSNLDDTVLTLNYTCDGYFDNTYTLIFKKFEGTKTEVSKDKKSFNIMPINIETDKTVILALYDGDKFVEMQSAVYTGEAVPFTTTKTYTNAKVMVWNDLTNLKPVCEVENVE